MLSIGGRPRRRFEDVYLTLLSSSWLRLLTFLALAYLAVNSLFALGYVWGGDCIADAQVSFSDAFFFSVQTMATIGYGHWYPTTLWAHALVTVETLTGLLGIAMVTGLSFAKFSRATARVLFSRVAVVYKRDGVPALLFRVANQRGNQIVEANIHVVLARNATTAEGESLRQLHDLRMVRERHALFALSWTAIHLITEDSPLYGATPQSLAASDSEIIVSLTGFDESFAQMVHARHSYVPDEIIWGARFVDILSRTPDGHRIVDYTHFHDVIRVDTP